MRTRPALDFETLYIFGAGGHGREVAWLARESWPGVPDLVFLVDDKKYVRGPVDDVPVRLFEDEQFASSARYLVAVGDPRARSRITGTIEARGVSAATLVHPSASLSERVTIGAGSIVFPGCVLTTNIELGAHVHVNSASTISHDARIGRFTSLSPGVHIAGNVQVGEQVFLGTGANVINGREDAPLVIGDRAVVAAGACVIAPVGADELVAGVPAVRKR